MSKLFFCNLIGVLVASASMAGAPENINLEAHLDRPAPIYAVGDHLNLSVQASRNSILSVILVDSAGEILRVAPKRPGQNLRLEKGKVVTLPFTVTPPVGHYELRIVATDASSNRTTRGIETADARLSDRDLREDKTLSFEVMDPRRP